jgi:sulfate adenylyltransferase subunit 2
MRLHLTHLERLESESIAIIREAVQDFKKLGILFSGGKDSIVVTELAIRAFAHAPCPFELLHVDTGHNFPETIEFRDQYTKERNLKLHIERVEDSIRRGTAQDEKGFHPTRNRIQSVTLTEAIEKHQFDLLLGGARRDEDKARAKERIFSFRDEFGSWEPKNQRIEFFQHFDLLKTPGQHFRVFPISNWTEMDVWNYIRWRNIPLPPLYFSHEREVFERKGVIYAKNPFLELKPEEKYFTQTVRFRTIGDMTCTGALVSSAKSMDEVIQEISGLKWTERSTRADDQFSETAMEDRKSQGYF